MAGCALMCAAKDLYVRSTPPDGSHPTPLVNNVQLSTRQSYHSLPSSNCRPTQPTHHAVLVGVNECTENHTSPSATPDALLDLPDGGDSSGSVDLLLPAVDPRQQSSPLVREYG